MSGLDLFWQAAIFSSIALGIPLALALWLYVSPLRMPVKGGRLNRKWATRFALMLGGCVLAMNVGAYWDASEHIVTGIVPGGKDFLWPPHLVLYGGFLLALIVAIMAVIAIAGPNLRAGVRDPRIWVRRNPLLGAVALSSGYAIFAIPGDAIWHQLFGVDLTAWSPPHVLLGFSLASVGICAAALLAQTSEESQPETWRDVIVVAILALVMSELYLVGVLEWEVPGKLALRNTLERPIWLYPVLSALLSYVILILARHLTGLKWAATITATAFFLIRIGVIGGLVLAKGVSPHLPLLFFLGAIALDLAPASVGTWVKRALVASTLYSAGFALTAFPNLALLGLAFEPSDYVLAFAVTWAICVILHPLVSLLGAWFRDQSLPTRADDPAIVPVLAD